MQSVGIKDLEMVDQTGAASTGASSSSDISIHPDGRQIVFNAGFRRIERWMMENLLRQ